jgi:uncharacterized membrane protein
MTIILFFMLVGVIIALVNRTSRIATLERMIATLIRRLDRLENAIDTSPVVAATDIPPYVPETPEPEPIEVEPPVMVPPKNAPARIVASAAPVSPWQRTPAIPELPSHQVDEPKPEPEPERLTAGQRFEAVVGGKLPIWIGGIALILAGFFLVRYSIEMGLLGPGVRCVLAALFGIALLGGSEVARRFPKFASDARVGQSLAGAGIASLYGTLYMASELYGLIGPIAAFVLMVGVTAIALGLSLRHGPPTAIMGLIGGFVAPYIAGTSNENVTPVLIYLGLLIAGLFALAVHRGWLWLALAATGGSAIWSLGLMFGGFAEANPALGFFIVVVALGATLVVPRTDGGDQRIRLIPMIAGFVQLALFAPLIAFGLSAWLMYALLSAASLFLAWRDDRLAPAPLAALALVTVLILAAFDTGSLLAPWVTVGATLLFAVPGHMLARRDASRPWWAILALSGSIAPLLAARISGQAVLSDFGWGIAMVISAVPLILLSWRTRDAARKTLIPDIAHFGGAVLAALLGFGAASHWFNLDFMTIATLMLAVALAAWGKRSGDRAIIEASLGGVALAGLYWIAGLMRYPALGEAVFANGSIPPLMPLAAYVIGPGLLLAAMAWFHAGRKYSDQSLRYMVLALALALPLALLPELWHFSLLAGVAALLLVSPTPLPLPRFGIEVILVASGFAALTHLTPFMLIFGQSLFGETLHFEFLPQMMDATVGLALPSLLLGAGFWQSRYPLMPRARQLAISGIGVLAAAALYTFAKQPLAIAEAERFIAIGFVERAVITQTLLGAAALMVMRGAQWQRYALLPLSLGLFRFIWFDLFILNPLLVTQNVGSLPIANFAVIHLGLTAGCLWYFAKVEALSRFARIMSHAALGIGLIMVIAAVRQVFQGALLDTPELPREENYAYSAALLGLSLLWLWQGLRRQASWLRIAGLALLTLVTFKVFLIDASALKGLLRIFSFLGLGGALIGIGWAYGRLLGTQKANTDD